MIELQGKFGKDCKIFTNAIENEAIIISEWILVVECCV